jgi:hypothetical protein
MQKRLTPFQGGPINLDHYRFRRQSNLRREEFEKGWNWVETVIWAVIFTASVGFYLWVRNL